MKHKEKLTHVRGGDWKYYDAAEYLEVKQLAGDFRQAHYRAGDNAQQ